MAKIVGLDTAGLGDRVESSARCVALAIILDALEHVDSPSHGYEAARWFSPDNKNFCAWCDIAEVEPPDIILRATQVAEAAKARAILREQIPRRNGEFRMENLHKQGALRAKPQRLCTGRGPWGTPSRA